MEQGQPAVNRKAQVNALQACSRMLDSSGPWPAEKGWQGVREGGLQPGPSFQTPQEDRRLHTAPL